MSQHLSYKATSDGSRNKYGEHCFVVILINSDPFSFNIVLLG